EQLEARFIYGEVEPIYSKLAVEPVLRTYVLALLAMGVVNNKNSLIAFFENTFWAQQYQDMEKLTFIIERVVSLLQSYGLLTDALAVTALGHRVSQFYIDPLTANHIISGLQNVEPAQPFSYIHLLCNTLDMRPLPTIKKAEQQRYIELIDNNNTLGE